MFSGCQSESSTEPPRDSGRKLGFSPEQVTISSGQPTELHLVIENLADSIFAVSMQIGFADSILSFTGIANAASGGFWGANAVQFAHDTLSVLHITISRVQGQTAVNGSGTICTLRFNAVAAGNCVVEVLTDQLVFYNSEGRELEVPELEEKTAVIHVI